MSCGYIPQRKCKKRQGDLSSNPYSAQFESISITCNLSRLHSFVTSSDFRFRSYSKMEISPPCTTELKNKVRKVLIFVMNTFSRHGKAYQGVPDILRFLLRNKNGGHRGKQTVLSASPTALGQADTAIVAERRGRKCSHRIDLV